MAEAASHLCQLYVGPVPGPCSGEFHSSSMGRYGEGKLAFVPDTTKRPKRMCDVLSDGVLPTLKNVWLGTSVENQECIDRINMLRQTPAYIRFVSFEPLLGPINDVDLTDVHWAIVGGESGPGARPMEAWWAEELRDSCRKQGVAFFFKQWGGVRKSRTGRTLEGRTWDEYPIVPAEL
jgi:protein gp37